MTSQEPRQRQAKEEQPPATTSQPESPSRTNQSPFDAARTHSSTNPDLLSRLVDAVESFLECQAEFDGMEGASGFCREYRDSLEELLQQYRQSICLHGGTKTITEHSTFCDVCWLRIGGGMKERFIPFESLRFDGDRGVFVRKDMVTVPAGGLLLNPPEFLISGDIKVGSMQQSCDHDYVSTWIKRAGGELLQGRYCKKCGLAQ